MASIISAVADGKHSDDESDGVRDYIWGHSVPYMDPVVVTAFGVIWDSELEDGLDVGLGCRPWEIE